MNETVLFTKIIELPPKGEEDLSRDWLPVTIRTSPNSTVRTTQRVPYPVGEYDVTDDGVITVDENGVIGIVVDDKTIKKTPEGLTACMPVNVGGGLKYENDIMSVNPGNGLEIGEIEGTNPGRLVLKVNNTQFDFDEEGRLTSKLKLVGHAFDEVLTQPTEAGVKRYTGTTKTMYANESIKATVAVNIHCENWQNSNQVYNVHYGVDGMTDPYGFTIDTTKEFNTASFPISKDTTGDIDVTPYIDFGEDQPEGLTITISFMGTGFTK